MSRADLDKQPREVAAMFDDVAARYDTANSVLSFFQDRRWRRHMVDALSLGPGDRVLDVAAGTAVSTAALARSGAWAVAADFSVGMLRAAPAQRRSLPRVGADALHLPFADASFDAVTISFGLRNVVDPVAALREFARVTRPGGQLLVCEFSRPAALVRPFYRAHLRLVMPRIARRFAANPEAYTYLADSIEQWPDQRTLAGMLVEAGWQDVAWRNLTFGVVALHHALRT